MKFGAAVTFNAVEEWRDQYIDYDKLKRISLHIERLV
jgi:SPX domain protein involved in polyphosphate accumulation